MLNFGDPDTTQKATAATSAQIDFIRAICTSSSTAAFIALPLPLSLSLCLCSRVPHTISPFLYLPFYFFAATTKCLYKRHLSPTISAQIDFVCVLCTSSSTAAAASLSLSLSLCVFVQGYLTQHTTVSPFLHLPLYFFAATTKCLYKRHLFPTSLLARINFRFVTTGLILCTPLYATKQHFSP